MLQLLGNGPGGAAGGGGLLLAVGQLLTQAHTLALQLLQPGLSLPNLGGDGVGPALLLLQLPLDTVPVLQVVLNVGFEDGDGVFQAVGVGLPLHHLEADALGLHVLVSHLG